MDRALTNLVMVELHSRSDPRAVVFALNGNSLNFQREK